MRIASLIFAVLFGVCFANIGFAKEMGDLKFRIENLPEFSQFPAASVSPQKNAPAWQLDKRAEQFAKIYDAKYNKNLAEEIKSSSANFAGHYFIASAGCGTECRGSIVVDQLTGQTVGEFESTYGASYKPNSNLIVTGLPESGGEILLNEMPAYFNVGFYLLKDKKIQKLAELDFGDIVHQTYKLSDEQKTRDAY